MKIHAKKLDIDLPGDIELENISNLIQGFSGADIEFLLQETKRMLVFNKSNNKNEPVNSVILSCVDGMHSISKMLGEEVRAMQKEFTQRHFENVNGSNPDKIKTQPRQKSIFGR